MIQFLGLLGLSATFSASLVSAQEKSLLVVYPPSNYQTTAEKIFFVGTAPSSGNVFINGQVIIRSQSGHFAPSFPLKLGENIFKISYQDQTIKIKVTRNRNQSIIPESLAFTKNSLLPKSDIARMPGEVICFSAIATPNATALVQLGRVNIPLLPQTQHVQLPSYIVALTGQNQPNIQDNITRYQGCTTLNSPGDFGKPLFQVTQAGQTLTQEGAGKVQILSPKQIEVAEITANMGVTRTGPNTSYSRLTPLPQGTQAVISGKEGKWLRLDYGAWINSKETRILSNVMQPQSIIRGVGYKQIFQATEITLFLDSPAPINVQQGNKTFILTLYNATAKTDMIRTDNDPLISRLDWQQVNPEQLQYTFTLKTDQQWGYKLRYIGKSLVLTMRHPPKLQRSRYKPLSGIKILLDPGHGGDESGATGPTGYQEKDINLVVSKLLQQELVKRGAFVVMTREEDKNVSLANRQAIIAQEEPTISLSIHYNALPDTANAEKTKGIGTFWYHPQAHGLAMFLQNYLVKKLKRPSYGVFWGNLALTRPATAPSILLELGFIINPDEFEWIINEKEQKKLVKALADGTVKWFKDSLTQ